MGDDDGVPIAGRNAAHQLTALVLFKILLGRRQNVRARIKHEQFGSELAEHVVGNGEHRLARQSQPFQFHARRNHREGLARADDMAKQCVRRLHNAPHAGLLMQLQLDGVACARQGQVFPVECPQPDGIEFLVVFFDEPFAPLVVLPDPFPKSVFDFLLLFPRALGGVGIDHLFFLFAVLHLVVNGRRPQIQRVFNQLQSCGAIRSPFGRVGNRAFGGRPGLHRPGAKLGR